MEGHNSNGQLQLPLQVTLLVDLLAAAMSDEYQQQKVECIDVQHSCSLDGRVTAGVYNSSCGIVRQKRED